MRRTVKASDLIILVVALVLMIALTTVSYLVAPPATADLRGSTYSASGAGTKAAFLLLKQLGYTVERSFEPIAALHVEPSETVLVIASPARRASRQDLRALRSFLDRGGVVIATGGGGSFLPEMASVTIVEESPLLHRETDRSAGMPPPSSEAQRQRTKRYHAVVPSLLTHGAPAVLFESEISGAAPLPASYIALYTEPDTASAGVLTARFGEGRAIWAIGSTPFLNREIDKPGHLELLLNVLGPRKTRSVVLWDEYYHGYDRGLISYLATTQLSTVFGQLTLIAIAALFTVSRRRGPLRALVVRPRANAMEFVDAISALYQRARASSGAVETMRARLRRVLIASSQLPANSTDAQLAAAAAVRYPIDEHEVTDVLAASAAANDDQPLRADQALVLVRRIQTIVTKIRT